MADPIYLTKALGSSSATAVSASQTPAGAGNMLINGGLASGGVATLDTQRRVLFTFAADETGHTFVLYGTNQSGVPVSETIAGTTSGTVQSVNDYKTVTRISISAAATGAITVGTNGVGSTQWVNLNYHAQPFNVTVAVDVTGTVNYTLQYTYNDFWTPTTYWSTAQAVTVWPDPILAAVTADGESTYNDPITGVRVTINSGSGSAVLTVMQAGIVGSP